ncbi:hypothetical protein EYZ11_007072 [Aspergillus tanneri]|uniref:Uncharacterized protein n=1 Tax=Aspergillus tanneri TaxID=1220188 RepID=A0A4S3JDX0_9EURO|nr:hypothetical protein EYZ11_007072 [Aspergillus tanneri]
MCTPSHDTVPGDSPSEVLFAGDSADVHNLVVRESIKGAILLPPWASFDYKWPSVESNEPKDIEARDVTTRFVQAYLKGRPSNNYIEAVEAPEWWYNAPVRQTLLLAGADEHLLDRFKLGLGSSESASKGQNGLRD